MIIVRKTTKILIDYFMNTFSFTMRLTGFFHDLMPIHIFWKL